MLLVQLLPKLMFVDVYVYLAKLKHTTLQKSFFFLSRDEGQSIYDS